MLKLNVVFEYFLCFFNVFRLFQCMKIEKNVRFLSISVLKTKLQQVKLAVI
jgi:hypothetical protein